MTEENSDDLVVGGIYAVSGHKFETAIWDGECFWGPAIVDGQLQLVTEYPWSLGYPKGTCFVQEQLTDIVVKKPYGSNTVSLLRIIDLLRREKD